MKKFLLSTVVLAAALISLPACKEVCCDKKCSHSHEIERAEEKVEADLERIETAKSDLDKEMENLAQEIEKEIK